MKLEELFGSYLNRKLSEEDAALFEKLLDENPEYQRQFKNYQSQTADSRSSSSPEKKLDQNSLSRTRAVKNWSISVIIAVVIVAAGYFLFTILSMAPGEKLFLSYYEPRKVTNVNIPDENPVLSRAFFFYQNGEYQQALVLFENLVLEDNSELLKLYVGLSQLGIDRPEKAIPSLSLIKPESKLFLEANWYIGMGYLKLNKLEEAKKHLKISASKPTPHSAKAEEILLKLR